MSNLAHDLNTQNNYHHLNTAKPAINGLFDITPRLDGIHLTAAAFRIYTWYLNKPDGWNFHREQCREELGIGDHVLRRSIEELQNNCLVIMERIRLQGRQFGGFKYHRFADPEDGRRWAQENDRLDAEGNMLPAVSLSGRQVVVKMPDKTEIPRPEKKPESATAPVESPAVGFPRVENQPTISNRVRKKRVLGREAVRLTPDDLTLRFQKENPDTKFTKNKIHKYAWHYLAFCKKVNGTPTHEGFGDKMDAKTEQRAGRKTPKKRHQGKGNGQPHHCDTRTTEDKLTDNSWTDGPFLDLGDDDQPVNSSPVNPLF